MFTLIQKYAADSTYCVKITQNWDALIKTTIMLNKNYSHSVEQELHLC